MATDALRSLWAEPRPTKAPDRRPRDWTLVAVLICWSLVEVVLRQDLAPRPLLLLATLAVLGPLLWRRTHPLVAVVVAFGTLTIVDSVRILTGSHGALLDSISAALILAYALFSTAQSLVPSLRKNEFTILENNIVSSVASAASA